MADKANYQISDLVELKKPHPCGARMWRIWRTGIDFGLRCEGCGRRIMIARRDFERAVRRHIPEDHSPEIP